ncbi:MAG TPA: hypothetical protein VEF76_02790 [Patescibacteria group bacterium]|nr:hypothetical protein [Patescibacteria group bacterium]
MDSFNSTINSPARSAWHRKPSAPPQRPPVVLTLDENGEPEVSDPRSRGGFYPYMTSGAVLFSSPKGMLIDVSA